MTRPHITGGHDSEIVGCGDKPEQLTDPVVAYPVTRRAQSRREVPPVDRRTGRNKVVPDCAGGSRQVVPSFARPM